MLPGILSLLRGQMQVQFGAVSETITDPIYNDGAFLLATDGFVFTTPGGVRLGYRLGQGVTAEIPADDLRDEYELYLWGTVFGAVAWLNGLFALHASAVARDGRVFAFTADSGGGKSTLAAALVARHGFAHVCDDTLVLAAGKSGLLALPDGKPLKLWGDALGLVGAQAGAAIRSIPGKHYASPAIRAEVPLPLTDLLFLEAGEGPAIAAITGARKLGLLPEALYREFVHIARGDRDLHTRFMVRIAETVRIWRLSRPFDPMSFEEDVAAIAARLCALPD